MRRSSLAFALAVCPWPGAILASSLAAQAEPLFQLHATPLQWNLGPGERFYPGPGSGVQAFGAIAGEWTIFGARSARVWLPTTGVIAASAIASTSIYGWQLTGDTGTAIGLAQGPGGWSLVAMPVGAPAPIVMPRPGTTTLGAYPFPLAVSGSDVVLCRWSLAGESAWRSNGTAANATWTRIPEPPLPAGATSGAIEAGAIDGSGRVALNQRLEGLPQTAHRVLHFDGAITQVIVPHTAAATVTGVAMTTDGDVTFEYRASAGGELRIGHWQRATGAVRDEGPMTRTSGRHVELLDVYWGGFDDAGFAAATEAENLFLAPGVVSLATNRFHRLTALIDDPGCELTFDQLAFRDVEVLAHGRDGSTLVRGPLPHNGGTVDALLLRPTSRRVLSLEIDPLRTAVGADRIYSSAETVDLRFRCDGGDANTIWALVIDVGGTLGTLHLGQLDGDGRGSFAVPRANIPPALFPGRTSLRFAAAALTTSGVLLLSRGRTIEFR